MSNNELIEKAREAVEAAIPEFLKNPYSTIKIVREKDKVEAFIVPEIKLKT